MRMKGLEPPRPETLDPKSNAATNYATCAGCEDKGRDFFGDCQIFFWGCLAIFGRREGVRARVGGLTGRTGQTCQTGRMGDGMT